MKKDYSKIVTETLRGRVYILFFSDRQHDHKSYRSVGNRDFPIVCLEVPFPILISFSGMTAESQSIQIEAPVQGTWIAGGVIYFVEEPHVRTGTQVSSGAPKNCFHCFPWVLGFSSLHVVPLQLVLWALKGLKQFFKLWVWTTQSLNNTSNTCAFIWAEQVKTCLAEIRLNSWRRQSF